MSEPDADPDRPRSESDAPDAPSVRGDGGENAPTADARTDETNKDRAAAFHEATGSSRDVLVAVLGLLVLGAIVYGLVLL